MIGKDRIVFDVGAIEFADNVGAYVRSGQGGSLVTNHALADSNPGISFVFVDGDISADTITETAHGLMTGDRVQFTTSGTLPTGLALTTDYYVIRVSANTFKVATSPANAELGTAVTITADGSGNHTLTTFAVARRALDVYVNNPLEIDVGLDAGDDSVSAWMKDGSGNALSSTGGALHVSDGGGSLAVDAVNLDIRDLSYTSDSVTAYQGTSPWIIGDGGSSISIDDNGSSITVDGTVAVTQSTSPWVIGDGGSSITVDAVNLDIRDLAAASDSVASWTKDGAGTSITSTLVSGKQGLDVYITNSAAVTVSDAALANTALLSTQKNVTTTAALLASQLADRKYLFVQNLGSKPVYLGASGVSNSTGIRISSGVLAEFRFGAALSLHAVSQDGNAQDCRILEAS